MAMGYKCVVQYMDGKEETIDNLDLISYNCGVGRIEVSGVSPPKNDLVNLVGHGHPILVSKGDLSSEIGRTIPMGNVRHVSFSEKD